MLAQRDHLIGNSIDFWTFCVQHSIDMIQNSLNPLLIGFSSHSVQVGEQTARVAGDPLQLSPRLRDQGVSVVCDASHFASDLIQTSGLLRLNGRSRRKALGIVAAGSNRSEEHTSEL